MPDDDTAAAMMDAAGLPPLDGEQRTAELLCAMAHRCADWEVWGGPRAIRYWDALTARVRQACYAGPGLAMWWERLTVQMSLTPPARKADRALLASLLAGGADQAVLAVLRREAEALVLRVRVAADTRREARAPRAGTADAGKAGEDHAELPF